MPRKFGDPPRGAAEALLAHVGSTLEALAPCSAAVLVSREGELLLERYLRGPNPQDPAAPDPGPDSLWPWWSLSKSVTAALVARLVAGGAFGLDDPLSAAFPEFREAGPGPFDRGAARVRHLLSHSSGLALPGRTENGVDLGPEPRLEDLAAVVQPGSRFAYSSLGMNLLERFIEARTGSDYGELLEREVLRPFGLSETGYLFIEDLARAAAAPAAVWGGPGAPPAQPPRAARAARALPCMDGRVVPSQRRQRCGLGLYGSARDLLSFGEAWLGRKDSGGAEWISPALRAEFWSPHSRRPSDGADYGYLWWIFPDRGGVVASGASYGLCALLPERGIAAVVARNHIGPTARPFDYFQDKRRILDLAAAFAP